MLSSKKWLVPLVLLVALAMCSSAAHAQNCLHWLIDVSMDSDGSAYTLRAKVFPPAASQTSTTVALDIYPDPLGTPRVYHVDQVTFLGTNQTPQSTPHLRDQFGTDLGAVVVSGETDSVRISGISAAALGNPDQFVWQMTRTCAVNGNVMEQWPDWYPAPPPLADQPAWWPGVPPVTNIALPARAATWGRLKTLYR